MPRRPAAPRENAIGTPRRRAITMNRKGNKTISLYPSRRLSGRGILPEERGFSFPHFSDVDQHHQGREEQSQRDQEIRGPQGNIDAAERRARRYDQKGLL